ncbi:hypothetical protein ASE37_04630 [Rhizobium sp. Root268]|nr:hypothetical protein ASC86_04630 [Rhizobium sp. Root1212]KRD38249.1 hypothetical protein ASE37_04630 [Rhizobium sp. Root268]
MHFETSDGYPYTVSGPVEALEALVSIFPDKFGSRYEEAVAACRAALEDEASTGSTRRKFLSSLEENGLPVLHVEINN